MQHPILRSGGTGSTLAVAGTRLLRDPAATLQFRNTLRTNLDSFATT
jgi:hypothetical protein